jgi:hypothetical protein
MLYHGTALLLRTFILTCMMNLIMYSSGIQEVQVFSSGEINTEKTGEVTVLPDTPFNLALMQSLPFTKESLEDFFQKTVHTKKMVSPEKYDDIEKDFKQIVYIDFNNPEREDISYEFVKYCGVNYNVETLPGLFIHTYTDNEKKAIMTMIKADFAKFTNLIFVQELPPLTESYSTIQFNVVRLHGIPNLTMYATCRETDYYFYDHTVSYGLAEGTDFRNRIKTDNAEVDVNFVNTFAKVKPEILRDLFGVTGEITEEIISAMIIRSSATIASHEIGHILVSRINNVNQINAHTIADDLMTD